MQYPMSNMGDQARAVAAEHHVVADKSDKPTRTLWGDAFKRLRKNKLAMFAVVWLTIIILVAVTADLWVPQVLGDPTASDTATMRRLLSIRSAPTPSAAMFSPASSTVPASLSPSVSLQPASPPSSAW